MRWAAIGFAAMLSAAPVLAAQKGGVLRLFQYDSPASMSIHEEALNSAQNPMMAVFNNLVVFKQDEPQNRLDTIVPELATSCSATPPTSCAPTRARPGTATWTRSAPTATPRPFI